MNILIKFKQTDCVALDEIPYIQVIGGGNYPDPTPEKMIELFKKIKGLCLRDEVIDLLEEEGYVYDDYYWDNGEYIFTLHQNNYEPLLLIIQKEVSYTPEDFGVIGGLYHTEHHTQRIMKLREWDEIGD